MTSVGGVLETVPWLTATTEVCAREDAEVSDSNQVVVAAVVVGVVVLAA